ncbi:leucyl aminopeptidase family protein [Pseudoxanthomonas dokdonensis]|uniref:Cytochrome C oxidase subunit II n=1 Tax=Pseudoxanthomonas dokdonensis TaxID=344882 RepID=A0A0R0CPP0_9GAMM|nr:leucyl aminopeptidase family protein [Pseudoxanthomonas dokdonensis]KRG71557.1 cytochrome C oxidase subunit II [Pseudoxanthomonas dokdonensis]
MNPEHAYTAASDRAIPLHVLQRQQLPGWLQQQGAEVQAWLQAQAFSAAPGSALLLPGGDGIAAAIIGIGDPLDAYSYAHAPFALPLGDYAMADDSALDADARTALQLGWGLGCYRFDRYKQPLRKPARLLLEHADAEANDILTASLRVRDWVNTPTQDMGPEQLEQAARELAAAHGAEINVISGDALLEQNFPTIHAVGRASHRAPRLIELHWGDAAHPQLAVVGKGVCFDTGGLDIKPADGMRNMKKDMGGAAHALALSGLIMARRLPVRLRLLVPAVENSIGPDAFRPGEVITTRQGVSVEIDNTDAEGRLILCDALSYAGEGSPDLLLDFATLTGAARIALGPDLPALFCNDDGVAQAWLDAGQQQRDPVWRMPLWRPYLRYLTSQIADMANAGSRMAGSVTAALYLERFVPADRPWAHLDVYAWNDSERPGRPAGGEALGLRSAWAMLKARYGG